MVRLLIFLTLTFNATAKAEVLFEGYSKIMSGGVHVGYAIARYEVDMKKKRFIATTFLKTGSLGSDITESLKAVSQLDNYKPVSYEYTSVVGKAVKTIDAKFTKNKMNASVTEAGKTKTVVKDLPKDTFLSSILVYNMLKSGLKTKEKRIYQGVAEEDAEVFEGDAYVAAEEEKEGIKAFRILNRFKGIKFISFVTDRGEIIGSSSPELGLETLLVSKPQDAIGNFTLSSAILKKLFGDVPQGTTNIISKTKLEKALAKPKIDTMPTKSDEEAK